MEINAPCVIDLNNLDINYVTAVNMTEKTLCDVLTSSRTTNLNLAIMMFYRLEAENKMSSPHSDFVYLILR